MIHISHAATAAVPIDVAFGYVDDHHTVPDWMYGVSMFEPVEECENGLGSVYNTAMQIGPMTVHSTLEVTEWAENDRITLSSIAGFGTFSTWAFEALGDEETRLSVVFGYELPGGLAGMALGRLIAPFVGTAIRHTETALQRNLENLRAD